MREWVLIKIHWHIENKCLLKYSRGKEDAPSEKYRKKEREIMRQIYVFSFVVNCIDVFYGPNRWTYKVNIAKSTTATTKK